MASDSPDELVNMTYLSYFRDKWDELKAMASAELLGDNPRTVKAKKPVNFTLSTYNVTSPGQITVNVTDKVLSLSSLTTSPFILSPISPSFPLPHLLPSSLFSLFSSFLSPRSLLSPDHRQALPR